MSFVFLPCLLPNFKMVFIKVTGMTLNQQTHLCKMNFFFFSNSIWFLFWEFILPGWVEITSINLKISLPRLPTPFPWILCQCRNHTRCQACSEGAFVLRCAGSDCIVCAVAWPWSSIIISPTGRLWFCPWSHLVWCLADCMCARLWDSFPRVGKLYFLPSFYQLFGLYPEPLNSVADYFCFSTCHIHCL